MGEEEAAARLEAVGVSAAHGGRRVVHDVSVALVPGGVTALVGANGSGKSTVMRTLAGLHPAAAGRVLLDGRDLGHLPPRQVARRLSFLPQSALVPSGISVRELVGYGRYPYQGLLGRVGAEDRDATEWAVRMTGLEPLAERPVDALSGGEQQRAWLAMALAQRTGLLLLDEPTTYLDMRYQLEVLELLRDLADRHRHTIAVVLHDLNQATVYADTIVLMAEGRVLAAGAPDAIVTPELVRDAFGLQTRVLPDPETGHPIIRPLRPPRAAERRAEA